MRISLIGTLVRGVTGRGKPRALLFAACAVGAPLSATAADRWRLPPEVRTLAQLGGNREALMRLETEIRRCETARATRQVAGDACLDLLVTGATLAQRIGGRRAAEGFARRAAAAADAALPEAHADRALAHRLFGSVLAPDAAALAEYRIALNIYVAAGAAAQDNVRGDMLRLLDAKARYREGERLRRELLDRSIAAKGPDHPDVAADLTNLAINLSAQGREAEAHPLLVRALAIYEKALPPAHPYIALLLTNVGASLIALDRAAEALPVLQRALTLREANLPAGHMDIAVAMGAVANALVKLDRLAEAEALHRRALDLRRAAGSGGAATVANAVLNLANVLRLQARYADAEPLYREARDLYARALLPGHPLRLNADWSLAAVLLDGRVKLAESRSLFRRAALDARARLATYPDFGAGAVRELGTWRNVFVGEVRAAWALGGAR
ncbi:tetratricopeptide repeat protein [Sphingomonas sp.]|uniref:tetratricopeptide repeat protein n=1 Tax=Sphingomonas sp. TaxID=28214 RepID=UPI001ED6FF0F|nr:tetratricopeptide repeat protein [Sphingomonas sp.]MBX3594647.1 tetratricopeptide repeat protein [Sphingomonas sp.]